MIAHAFYGTQSHLTGRKRDEQYDLASRTNFEPATVAVGIGERLMAERGVLCKF